MEHHITAHLDSITNRWWYVITGPRLNGLDATYSDAKYKTENKAKSAAARYIRRWASSLPTTTAQKDKERR